MSPRTWYVILAVVLVVIAVLAVIAILRSRSESSDVGAGEDDSPPGSTAKRFDGMLVLSFERSAFTPCGETETRYWLGWDRSVPLMAELGKLGFDGTHAEAHVRFRGTLETGSATGYGHLGQYTGQVTISELESVSRDSECK